MVGSEGSGGLGEQGNGLKTRSTFRDADGVAFDGLDGRAERAVGFFEGPGAAAAVGRFGGELFDAFEFAEDDAALIVAFEGVGLHAGEVAVLEGEDDLLVGDGFAVFAEEFENALSVEGAEVAVAGGFGFVDAVEGPGMAGVEIAFFAAVAEDFHFAAERHGEAGEAFRHAERVREHAASAEFEVFDFAGRRNAVVGGASDGQLGLGEQFGREMGLA